MASLRNIESAERTTADRLLDAARESILTVGWKRATVTDVARRAGVSRMTVYRTYPDMPSLFGDLMTREWAQVGQRVIGVEDESLPWPERIAVGVVDAVRIFREDGLFTRILDVDPELVLPYLLDRRGRSQDLLLEFLTARIKQGQAAQGVRSGKPVVLARALILAVHGFVLSAHTMVDDDVSQARLDRELR
jgi:AcrR family transcriptional regulator